MQVVNRGEDRGGDDEPKAKDPQQYLNEDLVRVKRTGQSVRHEMNLRPERAGSKEKFNGKLICGSIEGVKRAESRT